MLKTVAKFLGKRMVPNLLKTHTETFADKVIQCLRFVSKEFRTEESGWR